MNSVSKNEHYMLCGIRLSQNEWDRIDSFARAIARPGELPSRDKAIRWLLNYAECNALERS